MSGQYLGCCFIGKLKEVALRVTGYRLQLNVINLADWFVVEVVISRLPFLSWKFSARPDGLNRLD